MLWSPFPMMRWALFLIAGVWLWQYARIAPPSPYWLFLPSLCGPLLLFRRVWRKLNFAVGLLLGISCLLLGWQWSYCRDPLRTPLHAYGLGPEKVEAYIGTVEEASPKGAVLYLQYWRKAGQWHPVRGKVQCQLPQLLEGQRLLIRGAPAFPAAPAHPEAFDYGAYLASREIYFLHRPKQWMLLGHAEDGYFFAHWSRKLEQTLYAYIEDANSQAIASALVLGRRSSLDPDLRNDYAVAGVMHVLAVSGMHVAILYAVVAWAMAFMGNTWKARLLKMLLQLGVLWGYALLTGFSASVVRSALMLSVFALGEAAHRKGNGLNTLGAAAFLMLLWQPSWLQDLGFQLSFLAVLGLMLLYAPLERCCSPSNWLLRQVWQLSCMSVAAQLATLPATLLYFHQFPTYFLLANLVVVPISSLLLIMGLLLLCISPLPLLPHWLGAAFDQGIRFMNFLIGHISALPYASIGNIYIDAMTAVLLYAGMGALLAVWLWGRRWPVWVAMAAAWGMAYIEYAEKQIHEQQRQCYLYKVASHRVMACIQGTQALLVSDTAHLPWQQQIGPHLAALEINTVKFDTLGGHALHRQAIGQEAWLMVWGGKSLVWINGIESTLRLPLRTHAGILSRKAYYQLRYRKKTLHTNVLSSPFAQAFAEVH